MVEYVRFSRPERLYGNRSLLHVQLETLEILRRIKAFQKLRNEELVLKIALKKKLDECAEALKVLDKLLPHAKMPWMHKKHEIEEEIEKESEIHTLDDEVEEIRRKLERLERG